MITLFIIAGICLAVSWWAYGLSLATICATVTTCIFFGRKFGFKKEVKSTIVAEGLCTFVTIVWMLLFKHFGWIPTIVYFVARAVFIATVYYDDVEYVYVSRVEKREENQ